MEKQPLRVAVLGASPRPERYASRAIRLLKSHGYEVIPIHPKYREIEGLSVVPSLRDVTSPIHTLTVYVGPERSLVLADDMIALRPQRVIFNPGTESEVLETRLKEAGIPVVKGCTLLLLESGQFETRMGS